MRRLLADDIGPGRQRLAQLNCSRPDIAKGASIIGNFRLSRADPRNPAKPFHLWRGIAVVFDGTQGTVARQYAAPFEQAENMGCGTRHRLGVLNLPAAVDGDQPAHDWFDLGLYKTSLANHAFEILHVRKTADRLDQIAIAVLIARDRFAEFGHELI